MNPFAAYLRLHGVKARDHAVFTELTRVKQYFEKLKVAENPVGKRENLTLDKAAAARIIKASLVGSGGYFHYQNPANLSLRLETMQERNGRKRKKVCGQVRMSSLRRFRRR